MMLIRIIKIIVNFLMIISIIAVGAGLGLMLCLKNDQFKTFILPLHPSYVIGQKGIKTLEDMQYSIKDKEGKEINLGILDINNDSWDVMLDFLQSEIAFLKSERNEPIDIDFGSSYNSTKSSEEDTQKSSTPINWNRIKTVSSVRVGGLMAGEKPLTAPYRLIVIWPERIPRRVYEFYSFEEFRLDMNKMFVAKLEYFSALMSIIGFITGLLATAASRFVLPKFSVFQGDRRPPSALKEKEPNN